MPMPRDPATLLAAARLYYLEGQSQADIATRMGTSRSNVSRMLTEAQKQGIVEIRINDPAGRVGELEDELAARFGLREVRVAHAGLVAGLRMEDQVGTQAARLLLDNLKDSMTVALSWGHALQSMVYATTADHEFHRISLVQLVGGLSSISNEISGQELVRELAVRLNAEYRFLHAPATLESAGSRDALLAEPSIRAALAEACRADLAFVGVGTPSHGSSSAILTSLNLSSKERKAFWGGRARRRHRRPLLRRRRPPDPRRGRRADPRHRARGPGLHPARRRGRPRPRKGPRRPRRHPGPPHRLTGVRRDPRSQPAHRRPHRGPHWR